MMLCKWDNLPESMRIPEVSKYFDILKHKRASLMIKRLFDLIVSIILLIILSPLFLIIAVAIKIDSPGPIFYRQSRITKYGVEFKIHKFRSMVKEADQNGTLVTLLDDNRITKVGTFIRKFRLDEISQLLDVIQGTMSLVGTRPEVPKYVASYSPEMRATLLMPAGVTSLSAIYFSQEAKLLSEAEDPDKVYVEDILPVKMKFNLESIEKFSFWRDIKILFMTLFLICGKIYSIK